MPTYIIEHLEPELYDWCVLEYQWIAKHVGRENLLITNLATKDMVKIISSFAQASQESVHSLTFQNACILDPQAELMLDPKAAEQYNYFIFGGILGNNPEEGRTKKFLTAKLAGHPAHNLGKRQFSTDTAVLVTKKIVDGTQLEKIQFQDEVVIATGTGEEVVLPYPYVVENGEPVISPTLIEKLKNQEEF